VAVFEASKLLESILAVRLKKALGVPVAGYAPLIPGVLAIA
jgi:hypothetical protein